ncbi:MAG TPA: molybdenum cofactor synthesis protein [Bacteroidales bacterium]|nr:molybdenum cofactor synthesis protein [Bacteroidales bacterium]
MEKKVLSVSLSSERGPKKKVDKLIVDAKGVVGDAHSGTSRPVSIIDISHINTFRELTNARKAEFGEFAENITAEGLHDIEFKTFDQLKIGSALLEVTQLGKPFHDQFRELGNYVMPRVGIFCRVKKGGTVEPGDQIEYIPKVYRAVVITLSDRANAGEYEDRSGPKVIELLDSYLKKINVKHHIESKIIPDDKDQLEEIINTSTKEKYDIIITTGGTGIGKRDITVDTIQPMLNKEIPGIMEMIRLKYGVEKPNALLSRGVAGVIDESLIYTLPGSVKAVQEYMTEILKTLKHLIYMLHGIDAH